MKTIRNILSSSILIGLVFVTISHGQEFVQKGDKSQRIAKSGKVLFIGIIEENWDNIEMSF